MAGREGVPDGAQPELDVLRGTRLPRHRPVVPVARGEVQHAARDQRRGAVGRDIADPRDHLPARHLRGQPQPHSRPPQHPGLLAHGELEASRAGVLLPLVRRQVGVVPARDELTGVHPGLHGRPHDNRGALEGVRHLGDVRGGPGRLADPAAGQGAVGRGGRVGVADVGAQEGLGESALALQPVVPPAQGLLEEADRRSGRQVPVGVVVGPGADQTADAVGGQVLHEAQHGVAVRVVPAADREDGGLDGAVVLADAAVAPVVVPGRVGRPGVRQRFDGLQALQPELPPRLTGVPRIGWQTGGGERRRRPGVHVDRADGTSRVVRIVVIAIVGGADRDDRLERLGREGRDLERVEAAPGDAEHADLAVAPGPVRQPVHHLDPVGRFGRRVRVRGQTLAVAVPADVHPDGGVAVARVPGVALVVTRGRPVGQAVRQVFEERRDGLVGERAPHPRVEQGSVRERDAEVLMGRLVGEGRTDTRVHRESPSRREGPDGQGAASTSIRDTLHYFHVSR